MEPTIQLFHLDNYTFGKKDSILIGEEEDASKLEMEYMLSGMKHWASFVILVHLHNHPHVLLLKRAGVGLATGPTGGEFRLVGDSINLMDGPSEEQLLKGILCKYLSPPSNGTSTTTAASASAGDVDWDIGECLAKWYRPGFDEAYTVYRPLHLA